MTRLLGPGAGLIQGDLLTRDRWLWLRSRLPRTAGSEALLDVGCGTGAFTICAALRGYRSLGLTWDVADAEVATERARISRAASARFEVCDVRELDTRGDLKGCFDFVICCENIEHIIDDRRLAEAIAACLKRGGRLLLSTPNYHYQPISRGDMGPFRPIEDGGHVRRGYTEGQLRDLFAGTGLIIERVTYCSGFFSQKTTAILRQFRGKTYVLGWALTLPIRLFAPILDAVFHRFSSYPYFTICVEAYRTKWPN